jgi:hypothetical protein
LSTDGVETTLVERILESKDPDLRRLVASGLAPLPLPQLLGLQVQLAHDDDAELAELARTSLAEIDPRIVTSVVGEGLSDEAIRYFAIARRHPVITEAILHLREVPRDLLVEMARILDSDAQETLLFRQDAIVEEPAILDALAENEQLSSYSSRRIAEYREHLLPREQVESAETEDLELLEGEEEVDEEEVARIRAEFEEIENNSEAIDFDNLWKASEISIRTLPVATRMRLARGATPLLRRILIRDQNPNVALSILRFSPIKESEVERIALSRIVVDEVLTYISLSKTWSRRYRVVHSLCQNPRTPVNIGIRMLPRLSARDLLQLSRNRNVPDAMRRRALRLYRIKIE